MTMIDLIKIITKNGTDETKFHAQIMTMAIRTSRPIIALHMSQVHSQHQRSNQIKSMYFAQNERPKPVDMDSYSILPLTYTISTPMLHRDGS